MINGVLNFYHDVVNVPHMFGLVRGMYLLPESSESDSNTKKGYYCENNDLGLTFYNPEGPLTADDLHVLHGILFLEKIKYEKYSPALVIDSLTEKNILPEIPPEDISVDTMILQTTVTEFLNAIGSEKALFPLSVQIALMQKSLYKLLRQEVNIFMNNPKTGKDCNIRGAILDSAVLDNETGFMEVIRKTHGNRLSYSRTFPIDFNEVKAIKLDSTRILHNHVCAIIWPGQPIRLSREVIESIFCNTTNPVKIQNFSKILDEMMEELSSPAIAWKVETESVTEKDYVITRK
jgi:hypothetical protein